MKKGIDVKQFKKWITKGLGGRCPDYCWDCITCRAWRLYDELEGFIDFLDMLDEIGCDKKEVRPHEK